MEVKGFDFIRWLSSIVWLVVNTPQDGYISMSALFSKVDKFGRYSYSLP